MVIAIMGKPRTWGWCPILMEGEEIHFKMVANELSSEDYPIILWDISDGREPARMDSILLPQTENTDVIFKMRLPKGLHLLWVTFGNKNSTKDINNFVPTSLRYNVHDWLTILTAVGVFLSGVGIILSVILKVL